MLQRGLLFLMLVVGFVGCTTTHNKAQTWPTTPISVAGTEKSLISKNDKVWVEAETKKVWVNSHVDENGDMVEGHYKHIIVTQGHWAGGKK